ncbi:hypothetical protein [Lonepinella sp. BR2882]|uniref:hypothetical protein n=1 Tax=Lonepinella sp. BR2882 TaxID=3095283 RepID=UPI003F6E10FE
MTTSHSFHFKTLIEKIEKFFNRLQQENRLVDDIYNEFSLQHELGIFLRNDLNPKEYKVQFERNIKDDILKLSFDKEEKKIIDENGKVIAKKEQLIDKSGKSIVKKEIDLVILGKNGENGEKYAVELKFPRNGQHPEQMYQFIKDIAFMEQLKQAGFTRTYCVCLVDDKNFYSGRRQGIYAYFRSPQIPIHGNIEKPTGKEKFEEEYKPITVKGTYHVQWQELQGNYRYYVIACE